MTDHPTRRLNEPSAEAQTDQAAQHLDAPSSTPDERTCLRCGASMIAVSIGGLKVSRKVGEAPASSKMQFLFGTYDAIAVAECFAMVCIECGYTELQTINPRQLLEP